MTYIFPVMLIMMDIGAAAVYATQADLRRMVYWLAAAILTACVTF